MTIVERTYTIEAPVEDVWELISDPEIRAESISVVERFSTEGEEIVWRVRIPLPFVPATVPVRTRDLERNPPNFVRFVGESSMMRVEGEHELTPTDTGCRVRNRFAVEGRLPGVESFFERRIDEEIDRMRRTVADRLSVASEA